MLKQSVDTAVKYNVSLSQKTKRKPGCKQTYDKMHYCTFCGVQIRSKISRHLINVHSDEVTILEVASLPKRSSQRRSKLQKLVNGQFQT